MRFILLYFFVIVFSKQSMSQTVAKNQLHHYSSESEEWRLTLDTLNNFIFYDMLGSFVLSGKYNLFDSAIHFKCDSNDIKAYKKYFDLGTITKSINTKNIFYGNCIKRAGDFLLPNTQIRQQENSFKILPNILGTYRFQENYLIKIQKKHTYYLMASGCSPRFNKESIEKGTWSKQGDYIVLKPRKNKQHLHNRTFIENKLFFYPYFLVAKEPLEFYNHSHPNEERVECNL